MATYDSDNLAEERDAAALERAVRIAGLLDLYGPLLTERQLQFIQLHYQDDLSFGEISREFNVSRQAIHDAVKHAEQALEDYESKLGIVARLAGKVPARASESALPKASESSPAPAKATASAEALRPVIATLEEIEGRLIRSGGVIYNADSIAKELHAVATKLKELQSTDHV